MKRVPKRVVPHVREFAADTLTPIEVYRRLVGVSDTRFLLESVTGGEQVSRFSFLGCSPREVYHLHSDRLERFAGGIPQAMPGPPLQALSRVLTSRRADPGPVPFTGGFVGFFGYDVIRLVERLPHRPPDPFGLPVAVLGLFDTVIVFDHARQRILALANEVEGEVEEAQAQIALDEMARILTTQGSGGAVVLPRGEAVGVGPEPVVSLDGPQFRAAVSRAKEAIAAGEIFQVVLARRFSVEQVASPLSLYRALRVINPSPYMVLMETPDVALVGASPEMLVRKKGRRLENRPIAGTRPRGEDAGEDRRLAEELLEDPKERAEHVMLVDLGRNDLGRVAAPGSVNVASFMEIERYSHVMHIVSSVEAELGEEHTALSALLSCFPAGTVSGAPKIRAMEIIDELEPEARGPYAGAVGYFSDSGDMDTCIAIRTLVVRHGVTSVTAGAGIVADSDPDREEAETENKAAGLLAAVNLAESMEIKP